MHVIVSVDFLLGFATEDMPVHFVVFFQQLGKVLIRAFELLNPHDPDYAACGLFYTGLSTENVDDFSQQRLGPPEIRGRR